MLLILIFAALPGMSAFAHCMDQSGHFSEARAVFSADQSCHSKPDKTVPSCPDSHAKASCLSVSGCTLYNCYGLTASRYYLHSFNSFLYTPLVPIAASGIAYAPETRPPIAMPRI